MQSLPENAFFGSLKRGARMRSAFSLFLEAVLQRHTAVEHQMAGGGILAVSAEIALAHELEVVAGWPAPVRPPPCSR